MTRLTVLTLVLLLGGCHPQMSMQGIEDSLRKQFADGPDELTLTNVKASPVDDVPHLYVAICDWETEWWGTFVCFRYHDQRIDWVASMDVAPNEQSIRRVRGFRLPGFEHPIIEVFGCTHMGNGSLYLYELRDRTLHLLLETRAVDFHHGRETEIDGRDASIVFCNGFLTPEYVDLNGDRIPDIRLSGTIDGVDDDGGVLASTTTIERFVWQPSLRRFVRHEG